MGKYRLLKVGSDAELFIYNKEGPFPICGLIGGTKQDPLPVMEGNGYAVQEDNVLLEFNIPPASSALEFQTSITKMLSFLSEEMQKKGFNCKYASYSIFPKKLLAQNPQSYSFGCEPDYCVWTKTVNRSPENLDISHSEEFRAAGYHIHVSYLVDEKDPALEDKELFVKAQDLFLGIPSTLLDSSIIRRHFYGSAGCFRPKLYGHEYRVLGGKILGAPAAVQQWVFLQNQVAIDFLNNKENAENVLNEWSAPIRGTIQGGHQKNALEIMREFRISLPPS